MALRKLLSLIRFRSSSSSSPKPSVDWSSLIPKHSRDCSEEEMMAAFRESVKHTDFSKFKPHDGSLFVVEAYKRRTGRYDVDDDYVWDQLHKEGKEIYHEFMRKKMEMEKEKEKEKEKEVHD